MRKQVKILRSRAAQYEKVASEIRREASQHNDPAASGEDGASDEPDDEDDLTLIPGIGRAVDAALKAGGISTFRRLSETTDDQLEAAKKGYAKTAKTKEWRKAAIDAMTVMIAPEELDLTPDADEKRVDDLSQIGGMTGAVVKTLRNAGVTTYAQVVDMTEEQFEALTEGLGDKAEKHRWQDQAEVLAAKPRGEEQKKASDAEEDREEHDARVRAGLATAAEAITAADIWCLLDAERTDLGNADRMMVKYGDRLLDAHGLGLMVWTGVRWLHDESGGSLDRVAQ